VCVEYIKIIKSEINFYYIDIYNKQTSEILKSTTTETMQEHIEQIKQPIFIHNQDGLGADELLKHFSCVFKFTGSVEQIFSESGVLQLIKVNYPYEYYNPRFLPFFKTIRDLGYHKIVVKFAVNIHYIYGETYELRINNCYELNPSTRFEVIDDIIYF
jgi:hypothetical protein